MRQFFTLSFLALAFVCVSATPAMADGPLPWKGSGSGDWNGQRTHIDEDLKFGTEHDSKGSFLLKDSIYAPTYSFGTVPDGPEN
jgi:hypothetical protein